MNDCDHDFSHLDLDALFSLDFSPQELLASRVMLLWKDQLHIKKNVELCKRETTLLQKILPAKKSESESAQKIDSEPDLKPAAAAEECSFLRRAFRSIALQTHPDKAGVSESAKAMFLLAQQSVESRDFLVLGVCWLRVDRQGFLAMSKESMDELECLLNGQEEAHKTQRCSVAYNWNTLSEAQRERFISSVTGVEALSNDKTTT